jgi:bleomycin hydrolase
MTRRLAITFALLAAAAASAQTPTPMPTPVGDQVVYRPKYNDPVLKEMEAADEARAKAADEATEAVRERQKQQSEAEKTAEATLRFDMSNLDKPASPAVFNAPFHFPPAAQYLTGTCWSFSTTSFYESEIARLSGQRIKLSEIHTVYWEYVEKMRRFVRERGDSLIAEGSESNAVNRIWRQYGVVPAEAYPGVPSSDGRHDHSRLVGRLGNLAAWLKQHDEWDEELAIGMTRAILDRELGPPPASFKWQGATYTPAEFLARVLRLDLDAYVEMMSTLSLPFYTRGEFKVPDNWWHDTSYHNLPLEEWHEGIRRATALGMTVAIGGDVSEPGLNGFEDAAIVPTFDIPPDRIDQSAREFRFNNESSTDDHGIHLLGTTRVGGHDWFLIKDSGRSSRWGKFEGYYFYRDDFVRLKMLTYTVHRDAVADILAKFPPRTAQ